MKPYKTDTEITTMIKIIKTLAIALSIIPSLALANGLFMGGYSKHLDGNEYNERHHLIAVEVNNFVAGKFKNSYSEDTHFIAYDFNTTKNDFKFGVITGVSHGYEDDQMWLTKNKFTPAVVPYISYTKYDVQPVVGLLGIAVFVSVKYQF